jgi:hypothetical protein
MECPSSNLANTDLTHLQWCRLMYTITMPLPVHTLHKNVDKPGQAHNTLYCISIISSWSRGRENKKEEKEPCRILHLCFDDVDQSKFSPDAECFVYAPRTSSDAHQPNCIEHNIANAFSPSPLCMAVGMTLAGKGSRYGLAEYHERLQKWREKLKDALL